MNFLELVTGGLWNRGKVGTVNVLPMVKGEECYRSLYLYGSDFKDYVQKDKSVEKFVGLHTTDKIVFDFDSGNLDAVRLDVVKFVDMLIFGYDVPIQGIVRHRRQHDARHQSKLEGNLPRGWFALRRNAFPKPRPDE